MVLKEGVGRGIYGELANTELVLVLDENSPLSDGPEHTHLFFTHPVYALSIGCVYKLSLHQVRLTEEADLALITAASSD